MDNSSSLLSGESENVYDKKTTFYAEDSSCDSKETKEANKAKEDDCLVTWKMLR